ncbi:TM2 domain-containing membrane protein YozV [Sporobacter termitidis DSM 10068]|uniref:TM2 domain-containing membrane protein YozV n=1 Tax=Sporobacter termitidis DSM 10068 TaxID=1123282 RepID=A0A1M5YWK1_9FIRM|nr:TM2 domain-containing protein [Sporobacter termitidis]SHI16437.1 TM2 domain-containing membrane protein YozV [Sporobacter termitidis DSM 10068]
MYCRNCGNQIDPNAAVCVKCGYQNGTGERFCPNCGAETVPGAYACTRCGIALPPQYAYYGPEQKSKLAAGLLGIFLGSLGIHNFYLGYTGKAVAQLLITVLTLGFGTVITGIWGLVEGILILTGSIAVDGKGVPLRD